MGAERIRTALWFGLTLLCLVTNLVAQGGGKKGKRKARQNPAQLGPGFPGLPQGPKAPARQPAGAKKPGTRPGQAPHPPAPPLEEADLVTKAADLQATRELEESRSLRAHFQLCDLDSNGWISLREAEVILSFDRVEYRRFDANLDGRVEAEEFALHEEELLARLGAGPPVAETLAAEPRDPDAPPAETALDPKSELRMVFPRPADLLKRYDTDHSRGLNAAELETLFAEIGLQLSTELVVSQMDPDASGQLEGGELVPIAWMASQNLPQALQPAPPRSVSADPAAAPADATPALAAPEFRALKHFGLLDLSNDGRVDESDLRLLQSPARLDVRLETVLAALDEDGDGRLSEAEFQSSMSDAVPASPVGGN